MINYDGILPIISFYSASSDYAAKMVTNYPILHEIEKSLKLLWEQAFTNENLQELTIYPDVEIDYYTSDFQRESSDYCEYSFLNIMST